MERHSGVSSNNRAAFRAVFRQFVLLSRRLDLYNRELLAVDATRIRQSKIRTATTPQFTERVHPGRRRAAERLSRAAGSEERRGHDGCDARTKSLEKLATLRAKRATLQGDAGAA
jgi:hypothetical protein